MISYLNTMSLLAKLIGSGETNTSRRIFLRNLAVDLGLPALGGLAASTLSCGSSEEESEVNNNPLGAAAEVDSSLICLSGWEKQYVTHFRIAQERALNGESLEKIAESINDMANIANHASIDTSKEIPLLRKALFQGVYHTLPDAPESLPDLEGFNVTWENLMKDGIANIFYAIDIPIWSGDPEIHKRFAASYGLAQSGNNSLRRIMEGDDFYHHDKSRPNLFRKLIMKPILKSEKIQDAIYEWITPKLEHAFKVLPDECQDTYLDVLAHAINYIDRLDVDREQAWLDRATFDHPWNFIHFDPDGNEHPYRKVECLIFRRASEGLSPERMNYLANKVLTDMIGWRQEPDILAPLMPENTAYGQGKTLMD